MNQNNLQQILQAYHENRLSHAFLIETNDQMRTLSELKDILSQINCEDNYDWNCNKCNLCHLLKNEVLPSLAIISPDGMNIKKNQILELKQKFSTKPIYSKYNMYIILNAEKFNSSSANTILKFLEEPEDGILGFFITNNKENMIDTIKSRCQIISNFYKVEEVEVKYFDVAISYLGSIYATDTLDCNQILIKENSFLKEDYQKLFSTILKIYFDYYCISINSMLIPKEYEELKFLLKYSPTYFFKQMKLIEELEQELSYNVNVNLLLDRFVLETR